MAKRRRSKARRADDTPGWAWMLFGLAIGLSVAAAVYLSDRPAAVQEAQPVAAKPEPVPPAYDDNGETATVQAEAEEPRFDFYELLKKIEVEVDAAVPVVERDSGPRAVVAEGTYILQAGSFSTAKDADRRRAELALHGIESRIVSVPLNGRTVHRVYIGPTSDLDELNLLRSRLRAARIDVLRITVNE